MLGLLFAEGLHVQLAVPELAGDIVPGRGLGSCGLVAGLRHLGQFQALACDDRLPLCVQQRDGISVRHTQSHSGICEEKPADLGGAVRAAGTTIP